LRTLIDAPDNSGGHDDAVTVSPVNRHRAAIIASLASGESILENFSSAHDCEATLDCLRALGVRVVKSEAALAITGIGAAGLQESKTILNAQNSGTTMRLLAGVLAGQPFAATITGDESLRSRPMRRVAEPLRLMGAEIELESNGGRCARSTMNYRSPARR
jgi:3-phosphoshikimate 1-carboxyvinyltransferase